MSSDASTYDASHITVLTGAEAVRKRPGMYIGSVDERGLQHIVFELADRAAAEVVAGRAGHVAVTLAADGGVCVADDGTDRDSAARLAHELRIMDYGARAGDRRDLGLKTSFGLGAFAVNALSSRLVAEVRQDGERWSEEYTRGDLVTPSSVVEPSPAAGNGTSITFWPDPEIFGTTDVPRDALAGHFRMLAFLNRELDITLTDERRTDARRTDEPQAERFRFPGGLRDFVAHLDGRPADPAHPINPADPAIFTLDEEDDRMSGTVEVALRWRDTDETLIRSFANCRPTPGGGTHEVGLRKGLVSALTTYARDRGLLKPSDPDLTFARISRGLTAVISVKLDRVDFEGCTRDVLGTGPVHACVEQAVHDHLGRWLKEFPEQAAAALRQAS